MTFFRGLSEQSGGDTFPAVLMTTKFKFSQIFDTSQESEESEGSNLIFWLTAPCTEKVEIFGTIEITAPAFGMVPELKKGVKSNIYSVRGIQEAAELHKSGHSLTLFHKEAVEMTRKGTQNLKVFVTIH